MISIKINSFWFQELEDLGSNLAGFEHDLLILRQVILILIKDIRKDNNTRILKFTSPNQMQNIHLHAAIHKIILKCHFNFKNLFVHQ